MSTKTTFKRVALVTVAALGFGVMSVAPSNAVINSDSLTLSAATAAQTTAETATATSAVATLSFLGGVVDDSMTVTASLVSGPAGSTALPYMQLTETASASIDANTAGIASSRAVGYGTLPNAASSVYNTTSGAAVVTAKYKVYLAVTDANTAPTVAGTYVVKLTPAVKSTGALNATAQTLTITVTTAAALDTVATSATSIISAADTITATVDEIVTASKTVTLSGGTQSSAALINVTLKNAALATTTGESYTATITGAGSLGIGKWSGPATSISDTYTAIGRAITVKAGDPVLVFADGTSGVGTITISSKAGLTLATEKITFFGAVTSIVSSSQQAVLSVGANNGANVTTDRPIKVVATDAAGVSVSNLESSLRVTSETTSIVSDSYASSTCSYDSDEAAYFCTLQGVAAGKTNITVGTKTSATDTTATNLNGNKVEVRVGSTTAASVKVAFDKASYAPGEKATLSVSLFDKDGLAVADGTYASIFATGGITSDFVTGTGSDTTTATNVASSVAGVKKYTIYMPQNTGTITFSWKTAGTAVTGTAPSANSGLLVANQAVAGTIALTVSNPAVDAAAAAAEEATAAANDATDAALSAAEAAEAATAMAQEAVDAVAELSASVTKLISALRAQITTLTNLVVKIQKKVKA
jgi:hypothetical protein